jgi:hypothetical protein
LNHYRLSDVLKSLGTVVLNELDIEEGTVLFGDFGTKSNSTLSLSSSLVLPFLISSSIAICWSYFVFDPSSSSNLWDPYHSCRR